MWRRGGEYFVGTSVDNDAEDTDNETDIDEGYANRYDQSDFVQRVSLSDPDDAEVLGNLLKEAVDPP